MEKKDTLVLGGHEFTSRFILGSGKFSVDLIKAAVEQGAAQIVTMALRRVEAGEKDNILDFIPKDVTLLPNTSSARTAEEAVRIARLSREIGCGDFIKIEVMRDSKYLLPDNNETIKATEILAKEGFVVLPYMYPDLYAARALVDAGAAAIMPLASPIGTNKAYRQRLHPDSHRRSRSAHHRRRRHRRPSQACEAMEMGAAAIMANTAIATAGDLPLMAKAFGEAFVPAATPICPASVASVKRPLPLIRLPVS